jgi:hypothetical protein
VLLLYAVVRCTIRRLFEMLMLYIRDYIRESTTARTENSHSHDPLTALGLLLVGKLGATSVNKRVSSLWLTTGVTLDGRWWLVVRTHNAQPLTASPASSGARHLPHLWPLQPSSLSQRTATAHTQVRSSAECAFIAQRPLSLTGARTAHSPVPLLSLLSSHRPSISGGVARSGKHRRHRVHF